jgi:non-lysosomal glucosylceramidase
MPAYLDGKGVSSGVPLGGIGAGKMEILPNGLFSAFTFLNNWTQPISGNGQYPGLLGYHLALYAEPLADGGAPQQSKTWLLQTEPLSHWPTVKKIEYKGSFPQCTLRYNAPGMPVEVCLEAWSPWIPGDTEASSMPGAYFTLKVANKTRKKYRIGLLFIGRNLTGDWCVGRTNRIEEDPRFVHLRFLNAQCSKDDPRCGETRFSFEKKEWQVTYLESWNAVTKNFHFTPKEVRLSALEIFSKEGRLPDSSRSYVAQGENHELCGAVAAFSVLKPGQKAEWPFQAAWHYPHHPFGHRYASRFKDVSAVQRRASLCRADWRRKTARFSELTASLPFPAWLNDALANSLSPFFASSWYTRDGRFAFYEAPVVCPLMGTLDVGFYGSVPLAYFFPELEKSQLLQFAAAQRPDGYIPHDLGRNRIDTPSNGTTFYYWKDLNPKFVLMAWRDALWSKDRAFLKKVYPHVKKALHWSIANDRDGNGLPDHEGADQTFDLWEFRGANAYTATLYLAALLAGEKMARETGDRVFALECSRRFMKGRASFERELWNGEYFGETCALSQLNGQWMADLLGLGDLADARKVRRALECIGRKNAGHSPYGLVNSVLASGRLDGSNNHSKNIWFGMNYAWVSLCLMRGFSLKKVLKPAHQLWDNVIRRQKNPWNQPDMIDSKTGRYVFGDAYYRNMAIWAIPIAYAKRDKRTAAILASLKAISGKA